MRLELLAFSALMWAAQFSPGPDMLLLIKNTLAHSRRAGLGTVLGIVCGLCAHCTVVLGGLAAALQSHSTVFHAMRFAGGLYLIYLGSRLLHDTWKTPAPSREQPITAALSFRGAFMQGLLTNLLNVKAVLFLMGALAVFHPLGSPEWLKWALGGIVLVQALLGWSLFVWLLGWPPLRLWFLRWQRPWNAVFGIFLITAGLAAWWSSPRIGA